EREHGINCFKTIMEKGTRYERTARNSLGETQWEHMNVVGKSLFPGTGNIGECDYDLGIANIAACRCCVTCREHASIKDDHYREHNGWKGVLCTNPKEFRKQLREILKLGIMKKEPEKAPDDIGPDDLNNPEFVALFHKDNLNKVAALNLAEVSRLKRNKRKDLQDHPKFWLPVKRARR
ncbi:MAG: hypothetical protein SGILL_010347, partial [Bacillariaceae sp.]